MNKSKLIKHLENDIYCRIGVSKISGVGVIAIRDIPKGVIPFKTINVKPEKVISIEEQDIKHLDKNVKKILTDFYKSENNYDVNSTGPNNINISYYLNHSDHPNIDIFDDPKSEYLNFKTNRLIKNGEELFINYENYKKF